MGELKYISFEEESQEIKPRVKEYWTERADSFFTQRQHELSSTKAIKWKMEIQNKITEVYGDRRDLKILDVGCGAGYFPVLLGMSGYSVTGIDLTSHMIEMADELIAENGPFEREVKVMTMDAEDLSFEDESFDVLVTRNLTWTLPNPIKAYSEWHRVLKKGGLLLNFDAEYAKGAHAFNPEENIAHRCICDKLQHECHEIYHMLTISSLKRPEWDLELLKGLGFSKAESDEEFYQRIFDEKDEFYIPDKMFMISAVK